MEEYIMTAEEEAVQQMLEDYQNDPRNYLLYGDGYAVYEDTYYDEVSGNFISVGVIVDLVDPNTGKPL